MSHTSARTDIACRNCGAPAPLNFCGECGQETTLHAPTLREFIHEFVGHYVALEGALWRSLGLLLFKPGRLTHEYLAGRRRRYVLPLRLYLTMSFVFFLALKLLPSEVERALDVQTEPSGAPNAQMHAGSAAASAVPTGAAASAVPTGRIGPIAPVAPVAPVARGASSTAIVQDLQPIDCGGPGQGPCNGLEQQVNRVAARYGKDPLAFAAKLRSQTMGAAPYAIFLLLPAFAGIVMLAFRRNRMTYGEHVVFSLHLHAFWYLALLLVALLPVAISDVLAWVIPLYGLLAVREVYGTGWGGTIWRSALTAMFYGVLLVLASFALVVGLLAMG